MSFDKDKFKVETNGDVATVECTDDNLFYEGDISKADLKRAFDHSKEYIEKCAGTAETIATEIMTKNKGVNEVNFKMPYGVTKRGDVTVKAKRSVTFPGRNGFDPVTRSDLKLRVNDPHSKVTKAKIKKMQSRMTEALLG